MNSTTTRRGLATVAAAVCLAGSSNVAGAQAVAAPTAATVSLSSNKVLLVLDLSGSMNEKDAAGRAKIDGAKAALKKVVADLPEGTQVGLRVYGSTIDASKETNPAACQDTRLVTPIGPLDKSALTAAIDGFTAVGETPMAYSLEQGVKDLGTEGKRTIVLVSDGEERCVPDPCPVARKLAANGVDLQLNAIGLAVDATTRSQLQCIASAGHGQYVDVKDTAALAPALTQVSTRTARGFAVQGQRINATQWPTDAPTVGAGQYVVSLPNEVKGTVAHRFVKFRRTIAGSTVRIGLTTQTQRYERDRSTENISVATTTVTPDTNGGRSCERDSGYAATSYGLAVVSTGVTVDGTQTPPASLGADEAADILKRCEGAPELYIDLGRDGGNAPVPLDAELVIIEEPPVSSTAGLPIGPPNFTQSYQPVAPASTVTPVVGGGGFSDAPQLKAGTYSETLAEGSTAFYKVFLEAGQQAVLTAEVPATPQNLDSDHSFQAKLEVRAPGRVDLTGSQKSRSEYVHGNEKKRLTGMTPVIEWTNRTAGSSSDPFGTRQMRASAMPGWYYFSLNLDPSRPEGVGHQVPVLVSVRINGTPSGAIPYSTEVKAPEAPAEAPSTAAATTAVSEPTTTAQTTDAAAPTSSPTSTTEVALSASSTEGQGLSPVAWAGGGVGVAALLGLLGWFALRRRGSGHTAG